MACLSSNTHGKRRFWPCGNGRFCIACLFPWAKVIVRRRGASPGRPVWNLSVYLGFWLVRGDNGDLPGVLLHSTETEPSH
jgi:hypothetical protein